MCTGRRRFPPCFQRGLQSCGITLRSLGLARTRDLTCPPIESVRPLPPAPRIPSHRPFEHLSGGPTAQGQTRDRRPSRKSPSIKLPPNNYTVSVNVPPVSYLYKLLLSGHSTVSQTIPYGAVGWLTSRNHHKNPGLFGFISPSASSSAT